MTDVPLPFGLVVAQIDAAVGDSADPGSAPDAVGLVGTAVFTGSQARFVAGKTIYIPQKIIAQVNDGVLMYNNEIGVPLTANLDSSGASLGWQWSVSWSLFMPAGGGGGAAVVLTGWNFDVKIYNAADQSTITDLTAFTPLIPPVGNSVFVKGDKGDPGDAGTPGEGIPTGGTAGQILVKLSSADYATAWQNPAGGGGVAPVWGAITGTLSEQTDLQTALDGKVSDNELADAIAGITAASLGAYVKPGSGIPKADLAAAVQTSLGKADAAQPAGAYALAADLDNVFGIATAAIPKTEKAAANGVATLGSDGKLLATQLPAIAISEFKGHVANQAAMLAITGETGDWVIRDDLSTVWIISGADPTQLTSWTQVVYPTAPVTSVAGRTGAVVLSKTDVGLSNVDNTSDANKPVSTAQSTAIGAKYTKPASGIPKTDLDSATQTSLGKADSALQTAPVTSVNTRTGAVTLAASDVSAITSADGISHIVPITTAAYAALATKDAATLYLITDAT